MAKKEKKPKDAEAPPVDGAEGGEGDAPAKKKFPLLIVIIAAAVLLLGGGGAAAYFLFLKPKPPAEAGKDGAHGDAKKDEKGGHGEKKDAKKDKKKEGGEHGGGAEKVDPATQPVITEGPNGTTYFAMPTTVANIQSPDGRASYLKLKMTFECPDQDTVDALNENMPRINDVLQGFIRELRPDDLSGSEGNYQLRLEILRRINLVLAPHKVNAVLITEMLVT
ncbi:flagellar basal body-associated FliL family protein [Asticcacaulis sp. 201]|uniref:flagellar basal body-associated FliL family protein n=1 Tax=Asticcacaulis sp. 201 TaxID=3028787 RepID=UPI0029169B8E|nr:flagellar basal body-associated FliL family protein [Asticcacaulis sp. 201]MDV6330551.1 flagellar basal body-associated FliL family protein [Asticcacaulis sp. 201]